MQDQREERSHRLTYTKYQLELLNAIYAKFKYPNQHQKQLLAKRIGITRSQVKIWFQNRRRKEITEKPSQRKYAERKCVPQAVVDSVIAELSQYDNEFKHKNVAAYLKTSPKSNSSSSSDEELPRFVPKGQDKPSSEPICVKNPPNAVAPACGQYNEQLVARKTDFTVYVPNSTTVPNFPCFNKDHTPLYFDASSYLYN